jgi:PA14 domain
LTGLLVLMAWTPARAFYGVVKTTNGIQFEGAIHLTAGFFSIHQPDGQTNRVTVAQLAALWPIDPPPPPPPPPTQSEHGLVGAYFNTRDHQGMPVSRLDPVVDFDWKDGSPMPAIHPDNFSVRWEGEVEAPASGPFEFYVEGNDGVRLWVNGQEIIDQWHNQSRTEHKGLIALEGGKRYPLKMEQFEDGGTAVARLLWRPPGQTKAVVPSERLYPGKNAQPAPMNPPAGQHGLRGTYFAAKDFQNPKLQRLDPEVNFDWKGGSPADLVPADLFSVRWEGWVEAPVTGRFIFHTQSDDGVRLWIDGKKLIDRWQDQSVAEAEGTINLEAGKRYALKLEYFETRGEAVMRLFWTEPSQPRTIIPRSRLFPPATQPALAATPAAEPAPEKTRKLPFRTEPDLPEPKPAAGVLLVDGSFVGRRVHSADGTRVRFSNAASEPALSTVNVARVYFHGPSADQIKSFESGRTGLLLRNGDFIDGEIRQIADGTVSISSILFGLKKVGMDKALAAALRDPVPPRRPATFEICTQDGSRFQASQLAVEKNALVLQDPILAGFKIKPQDLEMIRRN